MLPQVEKSLDLLFIGGDHSRNGTKSDLEMYSRHATRGGLVVLYDFLEHPACSHCEVNRFWGESGRRYPCEVIVENPNQGA